jgi:hypothetical protein
MLENYRVAYHLVASRAVLSSIELVSKLVSSLSWLDVANSNVTYDKEAKFCKQLTLICLEGGANLCFANGRYFI